MLKYLKAAFWIRPKINGLGEIPVNAIAIACLSILGFGNPGFWLLGVGLETAFLFTLALNERFQRVIDAQEKGQREGTVEEKRQELIQRLDNPSQKQLRQLETKCNRILGLYRDAQADQFIIDNSADALQKLCWVYLKLLISRQNLQASDLHSSPDELISEIDEVKKELQQANMTDALHESKTATLSILNKRLTNVRRREQSLEEIDSDLTRIEAQIDLAMENTTLQGQPLAISTNVELASHLLGDDFFGDSESAVSELDTKFMQSPPTVKQ